MARLPSRLIIASNRAPQIPLVTSTMKKNVVFVQYQFESSTINDIIVQVHQNLKGTRVVSIAFLLHSSETQMFLCFADSKVLSSESVCSDIAVKQFLTHLSETYMLHSYSARRFDFLNSCVTGSNANSISQELESFLKIPVGISKDLFGLEIKLPQSTVGDFYFDIKLLQEKLQEDNTDPDQKLKGYEKIRSVGKGAFGTAVLYRKTGDDSMVVIKEINMIELTAAERQMALNEVQVLSLMDHPNIISYYRSFEQDGVLMIEMEYADGGTLAQLLSRQNAAMDEKEILMMFRQMVAALRYMHDNNILHRDLKTANVFLTRDRVIKVGDFGISKVMTTRVHAQTVVGTPYYISPEMCEGKQYDQKSDIWALGCILYEMACLQKTFEGTNLPALVNKIMRGHFQPVPSGYSPSFRRLVHDLLQKDPMFRPNAAEVMDNRIPAVLDQLIKGDGADWFLDQDSLLPLHNSTSRMSKSQRSVLYELRGFEASLTLTPIQLPAKCKVKELSVSNTHYIALTTELIVLSWGEGSRGQLGHGEMPPWQQTPLCIESLRDRSIKMVAAGDGFSVFVSESGMTMTCGDGTFGCLGHGDWQNAAKPKLIEELLSVDVSVVSSGSQHVAVLSAEGVMYTWGRGRSGRLGLNSEEDCCTPMLVNVPHQTVLRSVKCGPDSTVAITSEGTLLACGRNNYNKLGLGDRGLINLKGTMERILSLRRITAISDKVSDVSLGPTHTTVLTESGHIITMGRNTEGQLGRNGTKPVTVPGIVKTMADKVVTIARSGSTYTVAGTIENAIYLWGTRSHSEDPMASLVTSHDTWNVRGRSGDSLKYTSLLDASLADTQHKAQLILDPREILALYASPQQISKGETLSLVGVYPLSRSLFVLVDTTVPLAKHSMNDTPTHSELRRSNNSEDNDDTDSLGPIPDWIRAEVAESEAAWHGFNATH